MNNKEQTAIEWLFEQFNNQDIPFGSHLFKEAKELEKQQMIEFAFNFYYDFSNEQEVPFYKITENKDHVEDYYNKTYNK